MKSTELALGNRILDLNSTNFLCWKAHIDKLLDALDFPGGHVSEPGPSSVTHTEWVGLSAKSATIIAHFVADSLLSQVDRAALTNHSKLLKDLERLAFSFRFLDLPAEIRKRVYSYCIPQRGALFIRPLQAKVRVSPDVRKTGDPPIMRISRQIREESLPLIYQNLRLCISFQADPALGGPQRVRAEKEADVQRDLLVWAASLSRRHLSHLRVVHLWLRTKDAQSGSKMRAFTLAYASGIGLHGRISSDLTQPSTDLSYGYAATAKESAKILGQQGDAIIAMLIGARNLWNFGTLTFER